jgi:hypothetical protein
MVSSAMTISRLHRFYGWTFLFRSTTSPHCLLHIAQLPATHAAAVVVRSAASTNISRTLVSTCSDGSSGAAKYTVTESV